MGDGAGGTQAEELETFWGGAVAQRAPLALKRVRATPSRYWTFPDFGWRRSERRETVSPVGLMAAPSGPEA